MPASLYAIAFGSNRRGRHGGPADEVRAALAAVGDVRAASRIVTSAAMGPSLRRYANAIALIESGETPPELLARLKRIEQQFGRRRGQRWGARVIDLDIVAWSGGVWLSRGLSVPHREFRAREFVLRPFAEIAPRWRDPFTGQSVRQLFVRLTARAPLPSRAPVGS